MGDQRPISTMKASVLRLDEIYADNFKRVSIQCFLGSPRLNLIVESLPLRGLTRSALPEAGSSDARVAVSFFPAESCSKR